MTGALHGRRLVLRPLEDADADALFASIEASRPLLKRRMRWADSVRGPEDCRSFVRRCAALQPDEALVLGVFELKARRHAGVLSVQQMTEGGQVGRFSVWIRSDRQKRGYAVEAGRLLLEHCFRKAGVRRVYARIDPANREARKVLQELGFDYEGCLRHDRRLNGRWVDQECWGRLCRDGRPAAAGRQAELGPPPRSSRRGRKKSLSWGEGPI